MTAIGFLIAWMTENLTDYLSFLRFGAKLFGGIFLSAIVLQYGVHLLGRRNERRTLRAKPNDSR